MTTEGWTVRLGVPYSVRQANKKQCIREETQSSEVKSEEEPEYKRTQKVY
jgi:hypothetical protein